MHPQDNVLLKTDPLRPLGFAPKLSDFGLTKILLDEKVFNVSGAGGLRWSCTGMRFISRNRGMQA